MAGLLTKQIDNYFFEAPAGFAAAGFAAAAAGAAGVAAAAGAGPVVDSSCFNCLVITTEAIGIRGELSISRFSSFTSSTLKFSFLFPTYHRPLHRQQYR